jgi:hypothetical protein
MDAPNSCKSSLGDLYITAARQGGGLCVEVLDARRLSSTWLPYKLLNSFDKIQKRDSLVRELETKFFPDWTHRGCFSLSPKKRVLWGKSHVRDPKTKADLVLVLSYFDGRAGCHSRRYRLSDGNSRKEDSSQDGWKTN